MYLRNPQNAKTYLQVVYNRYKNIQLVVEYYIIKRNQTKAFVIKKGEDIFISKLRHSFAALKKLSDYSVWINKEIAAYEKDGYEVLNTNI